MKFVLAPDSFKESMSAAQAVAAMRKGVRSAIPAAECVGVPMADGGEGTVDAVVDALEGQRITVDVDDPLGPASRLPTDTSPSGDWPSSRSPPPPELSSSARMNEIFSAPAPSASAK